jgi:hypothetical protein
VLPPDEPVCPILGEIDVEGAALYESLGHDWATADLDGNGIRDSWELALVAEVLCRKPAKNPALVGPVCNRTLEFGHFEYV